MIKWLIGKEFERMGKEAVVAWIKVLSKHLLADSEENNKQL